MIGYLVRLEFKMGIKVILKGGSEVKNLFLIFIYFLSSCSQGNDKLEYLNLELDKKSIHNQFLINQLKDSINIWIKENLDDVKDLTFKGTTWDLDAVYFDLNEERAIIPLLKSQDDKSLEVDWINLVYAEKIDGIWDFYIGDNFIILREAYNWPAGKAMTFEKLRQVSRGIMIHHYYRNKWPWQSSFEINQKGFDNSWKNFNDCRRKAHRAKIRCYCNPFHFQIPNDSLSSEEYDKVYYPLRMEDCPN